jgi:Flp pilus assembly protein CpaB
MPVTECQTTSVPSAHADAAISTVPWPSSCVRTVGAEHPARSRQVSRPSAAGIATATSAVPVKVTKDIGVAGPIWPGSVERH